MLLKELDWQDCKLGISAWLRERPGSRITVAEEDGVAYGFVVYDDSRIYYVFTEEHARGTGIATYLIKTIINQSNSPIKVLLNPKRLDVLKLFVKNNFAPIGKNNGFALFEHHKLSYNMLATPYTIFDVDYKDIIEYWGNKPLTDSK